jgi:hypothetical protein
MTISSDVQAAEARAKALASEFKSWLDQIGASDELTKAKEKIDEAVAWVESHVHGAEPPVTDDDPDSDRS